jgi:hypothetical protein
MSGDQFRIVTMNFVGCITEQDEAELLAYFEVLREQGVHSGEKRKTHDETFCFYARSEFRSSDMWPDPLCSCKLCSAYIADAGPDVEDRRQEHLEGKRRAAERERIKLLPKSPPRRTNIYIMRNERNGLIKIGQSVNPSARERTLQGEDPQNVMLFHFAAEALVEQILHEQFNQLRVRGEWFRLTDEHIEEIRQTYII